MSPDPVRPGELRDDDHYTTALYRAAIGPVGTAYYLPLFTQWELEHRLKTRWNWAAGLATLDWLIFRKMGLHALAYVGCLAASALLILVVGVAWMGFSSAAVWSLAGGLGVIAVLVPGWLGNRWFHAHCSKKMTLALQTHADVAQACEALGREASQRKRGYLIAAVHTILLLLAGLVAARFAEFSEQAGAKPSLANSAPSPQTASGRVIQAANTPVALVAQPPSAPTSATKPLALAIPAIPKASEASSVKTQAPAPAVKASAGIGIGTSAITSYRINVGLFAVASNAQAVREKLEAQKLPVLTDTLEMPRGTRIRVRVGPFTTQEQAQAAAIKIRTLGLEAVISEP